MKKKIYSISVLIFVFTVSKAQTNYLDSYIGNSSTLTTIGTSSNQINQPRDLDFKPNSNELWVCNQGTSSGGTMVIFFNAGLPNQTSQYRKDTHSDHFMMYPSAMAFGDDFNWAAVSEIKNTAGTTTSTFMGPALWSGDTAITARVFQNNWLNGYPLGSHLDMLHQSPFSMGIAHDSAMAYWVMDGHNGNICKYDYVEDHGPGYDDHSAGKIWRYIDVPVTRVSGIPSHMALDKVSGWLYFIDGGTKKIKRLNTNTGSVTGTLTVPASGAEPLAGYWKVEGATVEVLDSLSTQPCGIDYYNGRLIVSDYTTGDIYLYSTTGTFTLLDTIVTGHPGMMGIKVGPDGRIWCVNKTENKVYRLDAALPTLDAAVVGIQSPAVQSYVAKYYSTDFNVCDGNITPSVEVVNSGSTTITDIEIHYTLDGGTDSVFNWTGSLVSGGLVSISLPSTVVTTGNHRLDVYITMVNGTTDDVDLNNRVTGSFRTITPPAALPFVEEFATTTFPPAGWQYVNFNKNNVMSRESAGGFGLSTGCLKMDNYSGPMNINGQRDYLMTPLLNMTAANANTWLRFNVAYAKYDASSNDVVQVVASTDCGNSWTPIYNKSGTTLSSAPVTTNPFIPTATQWRTDSVNLSTYAGQPEVMLMITTISNYGNNLYLDDIFVGDILTGISEIYLENRINAYPNPTSSSVQLSVKGNINKNVVGNLFGADGRLLQSFIIPSTDKFQLDLSAFAKGVYVIKIIDDNGIYTKTIIKQ